MLKKIITVFILFFIGALPVSGQQEKSQPPQYRQEAAPVSVHQISRYVYELRGGVGSNSAFIAGENEVFLIDAKMTDQSAKDMIEAIKSTTGKPVTNLLLTHSDGDHVNGLPGIPKGINIIAHENSAVHMRVANESGGPLIPLPDMTFYNRMNLYSGDLEINLLYFGPAHTDGDVVIYVPKDNIAIMGDLFFKGMDPLIHRHKNGTSEGFVKVLQQIIDLNAGTYMSGHAEPVKKNEIEDMRNSIIEKRDRVREMISKNKSLDEIKETFGISSGPWPSLVEVIYGEMTR